MWCLSLNNQNSNVFHVTLILLRTKYQKALKTPVTEWPWSRGMRLKSDMWEMNIRLLIVCVCVCVLEKTAWKNEKVTFAKQSPKYRQRHWGHNACRFESRSSHTSSAVNWNLAVRSLGQDNVHFMLHHNSTHRMHAEGREDSERVRTVNASQRDHNSH